MALNDRGRALALSLVAPRHAWSQALKANPTAAAKARNRPGNALADLGSQLDQGLNFFIIDIFRRSVSLRAFQNPVFKQIWEMLVVLLIPIVVRSLLLGDWWASLWAKTSGMLDSGFFFWRSSYIRVIEYVEGGNTRMRFSPYDDQQNVIETTDRNNLLQKAIRLFMLEKYTLNDK